MMEDRSAAWLQYLRRHRVLLLLLSGALGVWVLLAKLLVPGIIASAYRGESWSILNGLISGRGIRPVGLYLDTWDAIAVNLSVVLLVVCLAAVVPTHPAFYRRFVGAATPGSLGAIRMLICAILLASVLWEDLASSALLPKEMRGPMGLLRAFYYLPGFETFVSSQSALGIFEAVLGLILFLGVIGWQTRIVIPLGALCYFLLGGIIRQYTWFYHTGLVPLYVLAVLSLTPCGDGWSVDRLLRIYRRQPVPDADRALPVYGWSRYLCWLVVALAYVAAGLSKLGNDGWAWLNPASLKRIMLRDSLNLMEFDWGAALYFVQAPDFFFTTLAAATVLGELAFVLVLFSWVARLIVPAAMMMMHVGILFFQNVLFPDLIALQLMFYNFTPLRKAIGQWLDRRYGRIDVLYDGLCPLCQRTAQLLAALDLFHRLELVDFRQLNLADYNRRHGLTLTAEDLDREMYVTSRSGAYAGFYAYRRLSLAVPALWLTAPWLFLPGAHVPGELVYRHIARNRLKLFKCGPECTKESLAEGRQENSAHREPAPMREPARTSRYSLTASVLASILLSCWILRIEFYPFTAMQMYTKWGPIRPITYYKVLARYESGETSRAPLETAIRALADSRYRAVIANAFSPTKAELCKRYLTAVAAAHNSSASPGRRITEFEIQKWDWDFIAHPADPRYGILSERAVFVIKAGGGVSQQRWQATDPALLVK
jgi:predicted DCC family thiol-disulfide oxidoreductase YuxK